MSNLEVRSFNTVKIVKFDLKSLKLQIPLTWVIELRDTGDWGFLLPPNQIKPTAEEMTNAFIEMSRELRNDQSDCKILIP